MNLKFLKRLRATIQLDAICQPLVRKKCHKENCDSMKKLKTGAISNQFFSSNAFSKIFLMLCERHFWQFVTIIA